MPQSPDSLSSHLQKTRPQSPTPPVPPWPPLSLPRPGQRLPHLHHTAQQGGLASLGAGPPAAAHSPGPCLGKAWFCRAPGAPPQFRPILPGFQVRLWMFLWNPQDTPPWNPRNAGSTCQRSGLPPLLPPSPHRQPAGLQSLPGAAPAPGLQPTWRTPQPPAPPAASHSRPGPAEWPWDLTWLPSSQLRPSWLLSALSPRLLSVPQGPRVSDPAPPPQPWGGRTLTLLRTFPQGPPLLGRSPQSQSGCWRQRGCDRC